MASRKVLAKYEINRCQHKIKDNESSPDFNRSQSAGRVKHAFACEPISAFVPFGNEGPKHSDTVSVASVDPSDRRDRYEIVAEVDEDVDATPVDHVVRDVALRLDALHKPAKQERFDFEPAHVTF